MSTTISSRNRERDFERMVLPHRAALFGHALSLTNNNADEAEDLVQETTLRALRGFDTFRADGPVLGEPGRAGKPGPHRSHRPRPGAAGLLADGT
jgi:DNA-directed RNA polymerase specialized sigma24 family protein